VNIVIAVLRKRAGCNNYQSTSAECRPCRVVLSPTNEPTTLPSVDTSESATRRTSLLNRHLKSLAGAMPYKCRHCDKTFGMLAGLRVHEGRIHKYVVRNICNKTCSAVSSFRYHRKTHASQKGCRVIGRSRINIGVKRYTCKFCNAKFAHSVTLAVHRKVHIGKKPYTCKRCGLACPSNIREHSVICRSLRSAKLSRRAVVHKARDIAPQRFRPAAVGNTRTLGKSTDHIKFCNSIKSAYGLRRNVVDLSGEKLHACKRCGLVFANISNVTRHFKVCSGRLHCAESIKRGELCRGENNTHNRYDPAALGNGTKLNISPECVTLRLERSGPVAELKSSNRDLKLLSRDMPHKCQFCSMAFQEMSSLRMHWVRADKCRAKRRQSFASADRLHRLGTIDSGEKPYACNKCGASFTDSDNLVRHVTMKVCAESMSVVANDDCADEIKLLQQFGLTALASTRRHLIDALASYSDERASTLAVKESCGALGETTEIERKVDRCRFYSTKSSVVINLSNQTPSKNEAQVRNVVSESEETDVETELDSDGHVTEVPVKANDSNEAEDPRLTGDVKLLSDETSRKCKYCDREFRLSIGLRRHECKVHGAL